MNIVPENEADLPSINKGSMTVTAHQAREALVTLISYLDVTPPVDTNIDYISMLGMLLNHIDTQLISTSGTSIVYIIQEPNDGTSECEGKIPQGSVNVGHSVVDDINRSDVLGHAISDGTSDTGTNIETESDVESAELLDDIKNHILDSDAPVIPSCSTATNHNPAKCEEAYFEVGQVDKINISRLELCDSDDVTGCEYSDHDTCHTTDVQEQRDNYSTSRECDAVNLLTSITDTQKQSVHVMETNEQLHSASNNNPSEPYTFLHLEDIKIYRLRSSEKTDITANEDQGNRNAHCQVTVKKDDNKIKVELSDACVKCGQSSANLGANEDPKIGGIRRRTCSNCYCTEKMDTIKDVPKKVDKLRSSKTMTKKTHSCTYCEKNYTSLAYLKKHVKNHFQKIMKCSTCDECFNSVKALNSHMASHSVVRPYSCTTCDMRFVQKATMEKHMSTHTDTKDHSCSVCGKMFTRPSYMKNHMTLHTGDRRYICDICGKGYGSSSNLKEHMQTRHNGKTFSCDKCGKKFKSRSSHSMHQRIHTGEKPYECSVCGVCFASLAKLQWHETVHLDTKKFTCEVCGKGFRSSATLNNHVKIHNDDKPHPCSICGRLFTYAHNMRRHELTHSAERRHICIVCNKSFKTAGQLHFHSKSHKSKDREPNAEEVDNFQR